MKTVGIVLLGLVLLVGGTAGTLFLMYQSMHDTAVTWENDIDKMNSQSENVLSAVTLSIQETAGIAGMYADDLKNVIKGTFEGRYGKGDEGVKASMLFIKESNPHLDSKLYLKVQDTITGGRKEFQISQDRKLEVCTEYKKTLDYLVRGFMLKLAGFPKKDITKLCQVVSDASTKEAFQTGEQKPLFQRK